MSLLGWVLVGALLALSFNRVTSTRGIAEDAVPGIVGAVAGGWLFAVATNGSVLLPTPENLLAAAVGSLLFLATVHWLTLGRTAI